MFNLFKEVSLSVHQEDAEPDGETQNQRAKSHIRRAMTTISEKEKEKDDSGSGSDDNDAASLFHHIVKSDMPESERSEERLAKEAQVLLGGGTASTARTIGFASFYILSRPELRAKLEAELREPMAGWPDRVPTWADLEKLPLLQAIIKESLR
jgi:cytochrome P450